MTEPTLKPCPFCGGEAKIVKQDVEPQGDSWYGPRWEMFVLCSECGVALFDGAFHCGFHSGICTPSKESIKQAEQAWNRRHSEPISGRFTLTSGQPILTDTPLTVYFEPYQGNTIPSKQATMPTPMPDIALLIEGLEVSVNDLSISLERVLKNVDCPSCGRKWGYPHKEECLIQKTIDDAKAILKEEGKPSTTTGTSPVACRSPSDG